jgi:hypothetical protein
MVRAWCMVQVSDWNEPNETAPVVAGVWVVNLVNILSVCIQAKTKLFHAN